MKKRIFKGIVTFLCVALGAVTLFGCSPLPEYEGDVVHYSSSDAGLANFLNDFTHRNLRFDEESIADPSMSLGTGTGFAKNWETMSLVWHNSKGNVLGDNKLEAIKDFLRTITQDGYGMIYNTHNTYMPGTSVAGDGISQGWPFPTYANSGGRCSVYEFNYASDIRSWGRHR